MKTKLSLGIGALALFVGVGAFFYAQDTPAGQKKVTFTPEVIEETLTEGDQKTIEITIKTRRLRRVEFALSDSVAGVASIQSTSRSGKWWRTQTHNVLLQFDASTVGTITGSLKVCVKKGGGNRVRVQCPRRLPSLPISVTVNAANSDFPPRPGEEDTENLAGIDVDGDGTWDYAQWIVYDEVPDDPVMQAVHMQTIKSYQQQILTAGDLSQLDSNRIAMRRAADCGFALHEGTADDFDAFVYLEEKILAKFLNTAERSRAYARYNASVPSGFFDYPDYGLEACDFNTQTGE